MKGSSLDGKKNMNMNADMDDNMDRNIVKVLWTGGYDSSFRICQLSKLPVKIQPYYLLGERLSTSKELEAMRNITAALKAKPDTRCIFLDLKIIPKDEWEEVSEVSAAYEELKEKKKLGTQYEWLGWYAYKNPGLELTVQKGGRIDALLQSYNAAKEVNDPIIGRYYVVDKDKAPQYINLIFGNYHFPIFDFTKVEMREEYIRMNCGEVIDMTWFCHRPIDGQACGSCPPCRFVVNEGLKDRHSKKAMRSYRIFRIKQRIRKIYKKTLLGRVLNKIKRILVGSSDEIDKVD